VTDARTLSPHPATPFTPIPLPYRLIVPLSTREPRDTIEHRPVGTRVGRGERLAERVSETAHVPLSPVAGRVVAATRVDLLNGHRVAAVEIDVDAAATAAAEDVAPEPPDEAAFPGIARAEPTHLPAWIDGLRAGGVWAERHSSPDLLAQLLQAIRRPCDTVVCHVLDGDASLRAAPAVASAYAADLVAGVRLLMRLTGAGRASVVVDGDVPGLRAALKGAGDRAVRVASVRNEYPQSDPTLLLRSLLRRRLRPGRLPTEVGVLLLDAAAAAAVGARAASGAAMLDLPFTVHDAGRGHTYRLRVPVGTPLRHVFEHLGVDASASTVRAGDALRDVRVSRDAVAAGGELVAHVGHADVSPNPDPCIRCGWCVQACPTRIHPAGLLEAAQESDGEMADRYGIHACIECGICSYVCPSRLPLLGAIRDLRGMRGER
jgi:Na+-translocating ferredoxin:NAD+ oxidoreductase subunit C